MENKQNRWSIVLTIVVLILAVAVGVLAVQVMKLKKQSAFGNTESTTVGDSGIEIYLPEVYYAASGLTMEIYNSQITNQGAHISEYNVLWECEVGESLERKYSLNATSELIGDYPLTVSVYDNAGALLAKKESTLSVVEAKQWQLEYCLYR